MTGLDACRFALENLRRTPMRTLLTVLGLAVGVGAILTVTSLGGAGETQVEKEIARLGVSKVWIARESTSPWPEDAVRLVSSSTGLAACAGAGSLCMLTWGDAVLPIQLAGYDEGLTEVHRAELTQGRMITRGEWQSAACVALADENLAQALGAEALGRRVSVCGRKMKIVGIVKPLQGQAGRTSNGTLIIPLQTYCDTLMTQASEITVDIPGGVRAGAVGELAVAALSQEGGEYTAFTLENEIDAARAVVRIFVMVLCCVAAVCMLTGGIGVMNILLVSVRERQHEIGLMKAVGATSGQVGALFLLESVAYALTGGALGIVLGMAMIALFGSWIGLSASLQGVQALAAMGAAALLGALFGVCPALRAACLPPADALRRT